MNDRPALKWLWIATAITTLSAAVLGILMVHSGMYYADAGYFLTQLRTGILFHGTLYRDFEFAYGPLLYYWPAMFIRVLGAVHVSAAAAYVISLCAIEAVGTAMLFYSIAALPMRQSMKTAAFLLLSIITLDPQEGLNYTAFRFVCSIASLVLLSRQKNVRAASIIGAVCAVANFSVSPEMGIAFAAASAIYSAYLATKKEPRWLFVSLSGLAGSLAFAFLAGPKYFYTLRDFANGGYAMMLEPAPHIYLLLFCAVGLAPTVVAAALASDHNNPRQIAEKGLLIGLYVAGLAMLPAALGRCDPLHVSFNGWPLFLLSFIALNRMQLPARRIGVAIALLFCVYSVAQEYALGSGPIRKLIAQRPDPLENVDMTRLQNTLQGHRVSFPWYTPMRAADQLAAAGEYQPLYLCIAATHADAERQTIQEVRRADYLLSPNLLELVSENKINNVGMKYKFRFGYTYKKRYEPYLQGLLLKEELRANWERVDTFGSYDLFHKIR